MATGPEHYRESEQLLKLVQRQPEASDALVLAIAAQAHATLADASAAALNDNSVEEGGLPHADYRAWYEVSGVAPKKGGATDD